MTNALKRVFQKASKTIAPFILVGASMLPFGIAGCGPKSTPPVNHAPVITSSIDNSVEEGTIYSSNLTTSDPDGDPRTYTLIQGPSDTILTKLNENTCNVDFGVTYPIGSIVPVTIEIKDEHGASVQDARNIIVCSQGAKTNHSNEEKCVIIADPSLSTSLQQLADYTTRQGTVTKIYSSPATPEEIRNLIKSRKTAHPELEDIVLAGDDAVPAYRVQAENSIGANIINMPSDLPYSAINGPTDADSDGKIFERVDDAPDLTLVVPVSRLPFKTPAQVANFINNLKTYDSNLTKANDILFSAGYLINPTADAAEEKDDIRFAFLTGKNTIKLYESGFGGSPGLSNASLVAALNSGCNIWNHYAHGYLTSTNCGGSDNFNVIDAQNISPSSPFIAYLVACTTGNFADAGSDCLAEALIKNKAVGVIAPTDVTLYSSPWIAGAGHSWQFDKKFFEKIYANSITNIGKAFKDAKEHYKTQAAGDMDYNWVYKSLTLNGYSPMDIHTGNLGDLAIEQSPRTDCYELTAKLNGAAEPFVNVTIATPAGNVCSALSGLDGRVVFPLTPNPSDKKTATKTNCKIALIN
jgi:hypothetical protein